MKKYRFKTKEEFIRDELWDDKYNCPYYWNSDGEMNEYLGKDIPDEFNIYCDKNEEFKYDGWLFQNTDYVLKEQQEYFNDLSQHIGRYIRALVDNPHSGSRVKKGDVGKIISSNRVDFPNRKEYLCTCALDRNHLGVKYELLPEDYSPEQETKGSNVEFIPGRWYNFTTMKGKYNLYVKVDFFTDKELYFKDGRYICNKSYDHASSIDIEEIENPRLVENLSEIQEYLPEGHPDKIVNQKFEIGKWYKWYQKNHGNYHYGKVKKIEIETDTFVMTPWIIQCDDYNNSGTFDLSKAEQIQEISVEEIQEFLLNIHPDKITSDVFKKGEYIVIIPEYIECTETQESWFIKGNIYKVIDSTNLPSARLMSNIDFCNLKAGTQLFCSMEINGKKYWKPSTKEAYEKQKPLTYESVSGCFPTDKTMFTYDEVRQYPLTPSECWKEIPKFTEQEFDIYGPTPDIE